LQKAAGRQVTQDDDGDVRSTSKKTTTSPRRNITHRIHSQLSAPIDMDSEFVLLSPTEILRRFSEDAIARQLALIDSAVYRSIQPVELLNQNWNKKETRRKAPNVVRMIERFNALSGWASSLVLWQAKLVDRAVVYEKLVRIAEQLRVYGCFNGCLAIVSGLNSASVFRLNHTKEAVSSTISATYAKHMELLDSNQSYKRYRAALKQVNPPCVPYLGVYLTDLTFIEDGNKDELAGLINFRKRRLVSAVLQEVQLYQNEYYTRFQPHFQLLELLHTPPFLMDEDYMFNLSLRLEPRGKSRGEIS
jgi:Rap guanine nucleotide exchange factor 1